MTLSQQQSAWSWAYVGFLVLTAGCVLLVRLNRVPPVSDAVRSRTPRDHGSNLTRTRLVRWAALAFLPSTLMLGATSHISTDVAAIPLLWVVPLSIYLGSFVLAFARRSREIPVFTTRLAVSTAVLALVVAFVGTALPLSVGVGVTLIMLAVVSYVAHVQLAVDRPPPECLTTFYMTIAAGGALGGVLNGLVAPTIFPSVLEYRMALTLVPLLLIGSGASGLTWITRHLRVNWVRATVVRLAAIIVVMGLTIALIASSGAIRLTAALVLSLLLISWLLTQHFSLALAAAVALVGANLAAERQGLLAESRTFYGTYRVLDADDRHQLVHGTTVHGTQFTAKDMRTVPTTYYSQQGPLGDVFDVMNQRGLSSLGAVGLGVGTVAAYGEPGQTITFFEVDAEVVRIARDARYFTYLSDSQATIKHVVSDGRLGMAAQPDGLFDLQVLDAFSSDSIPVHLLTREAVTAYLTKLAPGGVMVFHISNRVFDLEPVLSSAAFTLDLYAAVGASDDSEAGATPSKWVALSRESSMIAALLARPDWEPLSGRRQVEWTDDYSSVLTVMK